MALSIKFPIGARVTHKWSGPATVIGAPFKGGDGVTHLPVKWDNPELDDGTSGWHECYFTLIEPEMSFGDWAHNIRTTKLITRCVKAEKERDELALQVQLHEQRNADMRKTVDYVRNNCSVLRGAGLTLQRELDTRNEQINELESRLRMMAKLKEVVQRNRHRAYEKVAELENTVKVNAEYIELQGRRLINARKHLARVRYHCDLPESGDNGESMDP